MKRLLSAVMIFGWGVAAQTVALDNKAWADDASETESAELVKVEGEVQGMIDDFVEQRFAARTEKALNALITVSVSVLRDKGFEQDALEIQSQWAMFSARGIGLFDLGDHAPLNEWLSKTYAKLEAKLGHKVMVFFRLEDIKIFNYAIPVVFSPRKWDLNEYRLHFVPFAAATSYWISRLTCSLVTTGWLNWLCGTIAEIPRYAVGKWIAPCLGAKIHAMANGTPNLLEDALFDEQKLDLHDLMERSRRELNLSGGSLQ
jgi:hypothetical protein